MVSKQLQLNTAMLLLRHMNWNKERLIEKYMDNPTVVSDAAGIPTEVGENVRSSPAPARSPPPVRTPAVIPRRLTRRSAAAIETAAATPKVFAQTPFVCPICCTEAPSSTLALACGHPFCSDCWAIYVTSKIREEGELSVRCMATDCSLVVPDAFIEAVSEHSTFSRFQELVLRHYVAHQPQLKFCPAPSCINTVKCQAAMSKASLIKVVPTVRCAGGHQFCFGCPFESDHRPLVCNVANLWVKKCQDDSETANWIKSNTKECSKCQSTIEKNGGCKYDARFHA
jgi:ariadne-1